MVPTNLRTDFSTSSGSTSSADPVQGPSSTRIPRLHGTPQPRGLRPDGMVFPPSAFLLFTESVPLSLPEQSGGRVRMRRPCAGQR